MPRLRLEIAYDGTPFCGWQIQEGTPLPTIQACLEQALSRLCQQPVRAYAAGRTDTGVHALGQVVHVDIPDKLATINWQRALNCQLPQEIVITSAQQVADTFHACHDAVAKLYTYTLCHNRLFCLPQRRRFVWHKGALDTARMESAARMLLGRHDFRTFQNKGTPVKTTTRNLMNITQMQGPCPEESQWSFEADGFLKQMVRNLMGFLVAVGRSKIALQEVSWFLDACDRNTGRYATAPASGLCLVRVTYPATEPVSTR